MVRTGNRLVKVAYDLGLDECESLLLRSLRAARQGWIDMCIFSVYIEEM